MCANPLFCDDVQSIMRGVLLRYPAAGEVRVNKSYIPRIGLLMLLGGVVPIVGCGDSGPDWPEKPGPKVVASFPPLYCFVANVGGDDVAVKPAMTSQGPHHFDPKHSDNLLLSKADLFFINGLSLDEKPTEKMKAGSGNKNIKLIDLGTRFDKKELEKGCDCEDEEEGHDHHDHVHLVDPHVWLSPDMAIKQVEGIRDGLKEFDPTRGANYDSRAVGYIAKLNDLKAYGKELFKDKKDKKFVTFHGSMAYFARTFGLDIVDVIQKTPGKEPSGKAIEKLVKACVDGKVRVIAVEPQYSGQASAKRILDELRRKGIEDPVLVELDPLETVQPLDLNPGWYEAKMRINLENLAKAMR